MRSPSLVCADPARKYRCLDDASTSHGKVGLCHTKQAYIMIGLIHAAIIPAVE